MSRSGMRLAGKIALITGATSGIGAATAKRFASEGAHVVVAGLDAGGGERVVAEISAMGGAALFVQVDIREPEQVNTMLGRTLDHFGALDVLVANAGIGARNLGDGPTHTCTLAAWDAVMQVNLRGTFLCCKAVLPALMERRGNLITLSSVLGLVGTQGLFDTHAYATSKAGIIGLTRAIAAQYARDGVRANVIAPGLVDTRMAQRSKTDPRMLAELARWQPLGTVGEVMDVAQAAVFLASEEAKFITGVVLPIDGGWTAQ